MGVLKAWPALLCALLAGCSGLRETEVYYTPVTERRFPPMPRDAAVAVLAAAPSWKHEVIGRFEIVSDRGYPFLYRALLHNARLHGADAVVLRRLAFDVRRNETHIPPRWENVPQTRVWYEHRRDAQGREVVVPRYYTSFVPVFRPGEVIISDVQWTDLAADMIVRRGRPAMAATTAD